MIGNGFLTYDSKPNAYSVQEQNNVIRHYELHSKHTSEQGDCDSPQKDQSTWRDT